MCMRSAVKPPLATGGDVTAELVFIVNKLEINTGASFGAAASFFMFAI